MGRQINESDAIAFLRTHDNYLIYTHNSADADTIGSACALVLGLRAIGKRAIACNREGIPERLHFLQTEDLFADPIPCPDGYTTVSVDVASPTMLSEEDRDMVFELSIDHHESNSIGCERAYLQPHYPAAGEIIFELLRAMDVTMDTRIATALYAAISSDSGGFRFSSTRPETMYAAAELMRTGIDFARINRLLFDSKTPSQIAAEKLSYEKLELHFDGRFALVAVTAEDLQNAGASEADTECLNQLPRQIDGVWLSAVIKPKGNTVKCSLRSNEEINVSALASHFDGGGHFHAAGFSVANGTVASVRESLLALVQGILS